MRNIILLKIFKLNKYRFFKCELLNEIKEVLYKNIDKFRQQYGVLCFLYSIILTKVLLISIRFNSALS